MGKRGDRFDGKEKISIIVTVRNEERTIADLFDSLLIQEPPFEVLLIDAGSTDGTLEIVNDYAKRNPQVKVHHYAAQRGESRNLGIKIGKGSAMAFIDGDCVAHKDWLKELRKTLKMGDIAAGKTINIGYKPFVDLDRVELYHKGYDLTYPSCNLVYKKKVLDSIGLFDPEFLTAEDIDLNYRAIDKGFKLIPNDNAIVYHHARPTLVGFCKQAFWNGFGRKQLTRKHGKLWGKYSPAQMVKRQMSPWSLFRLGIAIMGYLTCKIAMRKKDEKR